MKSFTDYSNAVKDYIDDHVSISRTGTASDTTVSYQRIRIGNVYTAIDGTKYMIKNGVQLKSNEKTTVLFSSGEITEDSAIDAYADGGGVVKESMTIANGSCTIVFPQVATPRTINVKIYIR